MNKKHTGKDLILLRVSQGLKYQTKLLNESGQERYSKEELLEMYDTILNLTKIIKDYDKLEPVLKEFYANKHQKIKYIEEIEK